MVNHVPASRCHPCFDKQRWNVGCILPMYLLSTRYTFSTYLARSWKIKCTFWLKPKLYSQSTINIWRKLVRTAIWADKNGLVSVSEACTSRKPKNFKQYCNLEFNPEILIQFRISFHLPNLESERNKQWFKPCLIFYCNYNPFFLSICTWFLHSLVWNIKFDELDFFFKFELDFCRLHRQYKSSSN